MTRRERPIIISERSAADIRAERITGVAGFVLGLAILIPEIFAGPAGYESLFTLVSGGVLAGYGLVMVARARRAAARR